MGGARTVPVIVEEGQLAVNKEVQKWANVARVSGAKVD
jgi:hypothetical protein